MSNTPSNISPADSLMLQIHELVDQYTLLAKDPSIRFKSLEAMDNLIYKLSMAVDSPDLKGMPYSYMVSEFGAPFDQVRPSEGWMYLGDFKEHHLGYEGADDFGGDINAYIRDTRNAPGPTNWVFVITKDNAELSVNFSTFPTALKRAEKILGHLIETGVLDGEID